jgi:hypothetical protein
MHSENNVTLVGLWAGGLNLISLSNSLQSLNTKSNDERIVYLDQQDRKIADSTSQLL